MLRGFPDPVPGSPDHDTPARYLLWLVRDHRRALLLGALFASTCTVAQALMPAAIGEAIDRGVVVRDQGGLILWAGSLLVLGVVQAVTSIMQDRCALSASLGAGYQTMQFITRHACRLGATLPRRISTGEVVSMGVADITQIGGAMTVVTRGTGAVAAIVVVAAIMLWTSWQLGLVVLVGVPLLVWVTSLLFRPLHRRQQTLRERQADLADRAVDIVVGLRVLCGIGGEEAFASRYRDDSQRVRQAGVDVGRIDSLLDAARVLMPGLLVALVVWTGGHYVLAGRISAGQFVAFYGYSVFLAIPLTRLTQGAGQVTKGFVAAQRVTRLLSLEPEIGSGGLGPEALDGERPLADPASGLVVHPGRFTAVACASPSDAAKLADRLGRYIESDATYGSIPLTDLPLDEVRRRFLVADNDALLFSGPLRSELDPADRARAGTYLLERAIETASALDLIDALPAGLDGSVVGSGREFSGGQQQRLRLVRALTVDPEVLILIEPTNAVDAHTESRIAERLQAERAGRATVVFTTSPILLRRADHVSYVEGGRVVAEGAHEALLADSRYRSLVARGGEI